jgi:peptide/nickel transport system permease protein
VLVYLVRRVLWAVFLCFVLTVVTYLIFFQIPADPARYLVQAQASPASDLSLQLEAARKELGVDKPIYVQYGRFLKRVVRLDLGTSYSRRITSGRRDERRVNDMLKEAAPVTISLFFGATIVYLLIALPLGTLGALYRGSLLDRSILIFVLLGISAHPLIVGFFLRQTFAYEWRILPYGGYCPLVGETSCGGPVDWAQHLVLPWVTFAFLFAALYTRMTRAGVLEVLAEHWVRTARAKGAAEQRVMRTHVLRNAMLPIVTMIGMDLGFGFASAIFVEQVFGLPGLGSMAITALRGSVGFDLPAITGVVLAVSFAIVVINLFVDLVYVWLDPRIRLT